MPTVPKPTDGVARSARESEIRRVAGELFLRHGYEGTPVTRIAKAAGMTPANLYWYFSSKEQILQAVLVGLYRSSFEALQQADRSDANASERLQSYVRTLVRTQLSENVEDTRFGYLTLQASLDDDATTEIAEWQRAHRTLLKQILRQGIADGSFDIPDLSVVASMVTTSAEYVVLWFKDSGRLSRDEVADLFAALALRVAGARAE
jgi:AcrR family transcriptional regulator